MPSSRSMLLSNGTIKWMNQSASTILLTIQKTKLSWKSLKHLYPIMLNLLKSSWTSELGVRVLQDNSGQGLGSSIMERTMCTGLLDPDILKVRLATIVRQ